MESELINYILELCEDHDYVCTELHKDEEERELAEATKKAQRTSTQYSPPALGGVHAAGGGQNH